ncbi:MAG: radical SAM protein [Bacillota bacterium]
MYNIKVNINPVYKEVEAKSALHKLKRKIPYGWDLNLYRGCSHNCVYCYAASSHQYLGYKDFSGDILVKINIAEVLEKELQAPGWKREVINIGGVTDSYQAAEQHYRLMPQVLKLLIKYKNPAIISSKSDLILRDYDLIDQLSRLTYINVAQTITSWDESVREKIEPGAASSAKRFEVFKEFRKTNASLGLHVMPIIPYLTDHRENLQELCSRGREVKVDYLLPGTLYLRGNTRSRFFAFIQNEHPELTDQFRMLYKTGSAGKLYKEEMYKVLNSLRDKYNLSGSYMKPMKEKMPPTHVPQSL